jgi:hypothetical protein
MPVLSAKKADKKWKTNKTAKTAEQRKNEELYGRTLVDVETSKKN